MDQMYWQSENIRPLAMAVKADLWFHTGHEQQTPLLKSFVCSTHPSPWPPLHIRNLFVYMSKTNVILNKIHFPLSVFHNAVLLYVEVIYWRLAGCVKRQLFADVFATYILLRGYHLSFCLQLVPVAPKWPKLCQCRFRAISVREIIYMFTLEFPCSFLKNVRCSCSDL